MGLTEIPVLILRIIICGLNLIKAFARTLNFLDFFFDLLKKFNIHQAGGQTDENTVFLEVIWKLSIPLYCLLCGRN